MAKKIKKSVRKFQAKGGVSAMLKKGTVARKGKLKRRADDKKKEGGEEEEVIVKKRVQEVEDGVTTASELGKMDMDTFLDSGFLDSDEEEGGGSGDGNQGSESDSEDDGDNLDIANPKDGDDSDASSSASDDEDPEAAEKRMMKQMAKMAKQDPEFLAHLEKNDPALLDFGNESDDSGSGGEEEEEVEESLQDPSPSPTPTVDSNSKVELTPALFNSMQDSAFKNKSLKGLKKLLSAYSSACHMTDADDETGTNRRYHIPSDRVYDALVKAVLSKLPRHFRLHLEPEEELTNDPNKPIGKEATFTKSPHWQHLSPLFITFFKSTTHLLGSAKSKDLLVNILKALEGFIPLLLPFPRQAKSVLRSLLFHWSSPADSEDDNVVRLHSFLRIRQLSLTQPFPFIEDCLKGAYQSYAKTCKFTNETTLPTIVFMGNCLVELYSLDVDSSYQHAFIYIRQLALHLRAAITKKTKESFQQIYAWQYFNCLRVWSAVIANNPETHELRELIYPLVEIILGVIKLIPTVRNLPIRLHCVRLIQQLAASAELFIPTTQILLDALSTKELYKKVKGSTNAPPRLPLMLKLSKDDPLPNIPTQEVIVSEVFTLLNREVDLYRYTVAFPEWSIRVVQRVKKFNKETMNSKWRAYGKGVIEMCEKYGKEASRVRGGLEKAPKDCHRLEMLLPVGGKGMGERLVDSVKEERRLEEVSKPVEGGKKVKKREREDKKEGGGEKKKKKKKRYERTVIEGKDGMDVEEDVVKEGLDWSDDEE